MSTRALPQERGGLGAATRALWRAWDSSAAQRLATYLTLAAAGLLFLHAAATTEIVYTIRISQVLLLIAMAVCLPRVVSGWLQLPRAVQVAAIGLAAVYVLAAALADTSVLPTQDRSSGYRGIVYLADLFFGLGVIGLIRGLFADERSVRALAWVIAAGAVAGALYGIYQWFALRFNLPLADVNNSVNSDGVSTGAVSQGPGLFGGSRIRGTFVEPHFFAMFLASLLPLAIGLVFGARRRWLIAGGAAAIAVALLLTASAPAWGALVGGALVATAGMAVARGRVMLAAAAGGAVALAAIAAVVTLANPHGLSSATGRSNSELAATTEFRLATWDEVIDRWSQRPAIGFGPGQGAVKLATRLPSYATPDGSRPLVLGTAEGLWAAALLDGGVLALAAWLTFLGTLGWLGWRTVLARPNALIVAAFAAMIAAVIGSQVGGDRLELRVWVLFGLLAALSGIAHRHRQTGDRQAA